MGHAGLGRAADDVQLLGEHGRADQHHGADTSHRFIDARRDLPTELQLAKAYCRPCPMRGHCLAGAVERHEPHGVWGGEIFARGEIITEKRPRGRPPSS
jgi:hypothetical protein